MGLCILGSSFLFSAQGGRGKEKNCKPAEKIADGSEGEAEGGCGGIAVQNPTNPLKTLTRIKIGWVESGG